MSAMLTDAQIQGFRKRLEEERTVLTKELSALGIHGASTGFEVGKPEGDEFGADRNDNADIIEDMEEDAAAANELTGRLAVVERALQKMDEGSYGICEVSGEDIELDRLNANPAAPTCKIHME